MPILVGKNPDLGSATLPVRMVQTQITFRVLEIWVKKVSKFTFYKQNVGAWARLKYFLKPSDFFVIFQLRNLGRTWQQWSIDPP
jgi:hypothetical protein